MTLSILIVNWRSKEFVRECLQTVRATCANIAPRVIVVDGASFDGCGEMLAAEFPEVEFIQSPENVGFGRCNNLGFQRVKTDAVLFLNPDTELLPGAVDRMLRQLQTRPEIGIVAPRLLNTDGSLQVSCVRAFPTPLNRAVDSDLLRRWFPKSSVAGVGRAFTSTTPVEVEAVSGACMLMRAEDFRRVGGFSPQYFMYGEDMDLCLKVHRAGLRVLFVPDAEVCHHGSGSSGRAISGTTLVRMREAWDLYMRLNHGPFIAFWYRFLQLISASVRLAIIIPAGLLLRGSRGLSARLSAEKWRFVFRWALVACFRGCGNLAR